MKTALQFLLKLALTLVILLALVVIGCNLWISRSTADYLFDSIETVPTQSAALVLGTAKFTKTGKINLFFQHRMEAAAKLYHSGKVSYVIVSGDNRQRSYNETRDMRRYLQTKFDLPANAIIDDYAGFRTLDSVLRAKLVFGLKSFIVVSQKFQNERAIFIARAHGIDAVGFNATDPSYSAHLKTYLREYLARTRAVIDIYFWPAMPKFYQTKETIPTDETATPSALNPEQLDSADGSSADSALPPAPQYD